MSRITALKIGTALAAAPFAFAAPADAQTRATTGTVTTTKPLKPLYRNVRSFYRNVRSFWGEVNPFYRNVRSFWGDVSPFYGNTQLFWGTTDPVVMASRAGAPTYSSIQPFWDNAGYQWESLASKWQTAGALSSSNLGTYYSIAGEFGGMVATAKSFWGAAVTRQTGRSFESAFSDPFLARWGIRLNDPASFARLSPIDQSQMFIEWYDGLMNYSGTDHADWWMRAINWSPKLTQQAAGVNSFNLLGSGSVLGLVDAYGALSRDIALRVVNLTPLALNTQGHGEGVLSVIVAPHDGKGIMGIAPSARVVAYNPFDVSGTADWNGVSTAIQRVVQAGATVVNLSLGAPGYTMAPDWRNVFARSEINTHKDKTLYIIAAGNDGITQSGLVDMKGALDTTFIVVGSVGPTGISEFSNRPGTTCLTDGGACKYSSSLKESGYLMNRFIVAPGELILVSDGNGGVVRQSGTSLAAPMVAGAVALIQDRWPWMKEKPRDIAMVILGSAKDMGAPGIDPVYGVGMLDVEAAMAPLNFNNLVYYLNNKTGSSKTQIPVSTLRSSGLQASWATNDMYFTAFEKLDQVERDFLIPLSSRLHGMQRNGEYFQDYVYNRMVSWLGSARMAPGGAAGIRDASGVSMSTNDGWTMSMSGRVLYGYASNGRNRTTNLRSTMSMTAPSGQFGFVFGHGDGAVALGAGDNLAMASDFDPYAGGANPLLGFASGGSHFGAYAALAPGLDVKVGFSEQRQGRGRDLYEVSDLVERAALGGLARYRARATNVRLDYRPAQWLGLSATMTQLDEPNGFMGVRSLAASDLAGGTVSEGVSVGANADLGAGFALFGSATRSRSRSDGRDAAIRIADGGVAGSSYQLGIAKTGLAGQSDRLRLTVAQPLRIDSGSMELTSVAVVDRETGEKGLVTERFDVTGAQPRRLVAEGLYGTALLEGRADLSLFGRGELREADAGTPRLMLGGQLRLAL